MISITSMYHVIQKTFKKGKYVFWYIQCIPPLAAIQNIGTLN